MTNTTEFYDVTSIVGELAVDVGEEMYIVVVTGICNDKTYPPILFSFPSSHRFIDPKKQPRYSNLMKCGGQRIDVPYPDEYQQQQRTESSAVNVGILSSFRMLTIEATLVIWLLLS